MISLHCILYSSFTIPHSQLKDNLTKFVEHVFAFKGKDYITPNLHTKKAYLVLVVVETKECFSKDDLLECLFNLIDNSYVVYRNEYIQSLIQKVMKNS